MASLKRNFAELESDSLSVSNSSVTFSSTADVDERKRVEILIYNVSHADLIIGFDDDSDGEVKLVKRVSLDSKVSSSSDHSMGSYARLAKPKFNEYAAISGVLYKKMKAMVNPSLVQSLMTKQGDELPVGVRLEPAETICKFGNLHLASEWRSSATPEPSSDAIPKRLYFPLVALVVQRWFHAVEQRNPGCRKVIFLVSGSGAPRNPEHSAIGNSTEISAKLIALFIKQLYNIEAKKIHSSVGIFRFDDNVKFVNQQLRPAIEDQRRLVSMAFKDEDWVNHLGVTIALTDGAAARVSAINAGLREYKPDFLHMWELKSFWYYGVLDQNDLDFIAFEHVEMSPAVSKAALSTEERLIVEEMVLHKRQFERIRDSGIETELSSFWLRKSKKLVLSVLMVQKADDDTPVFYRGTNMEVSMPTGSLCSERNVIGTALAADHTLHRRDLRLIAVLSVQLNRETVSPALNSASYRSSPAFLPEVVGPPPSKFFRTNISSDDVHDGIPAVDIGISRHSVVASSSGESSAGPVLSPTRKRGADSLLTHTLKLQHQHSVRHRGGAGLNPTAPCGACNEWLKKIAEVNPDFKVITFTDEMCDFAFINHVL